MWKQPRHRLKGLLVAALVFWNVSCAQVIHHSPDELDKGGISKGGHWRVRTTAGDIYAVSRFVVTDSTLVIEKLDRSSQTAQEVSRIPGELPYLLKIEEVASLDERRPSEPGNTMFIVGFGVAFAYAIVFAITVDFE